MRSGLFRGLVVVALIAALSPGPGHDVDAATPVLRGWGQNSFGQLGLDSVASPRLFPFATKDAAGPGTFGSAAQIDAGFGWSIALKADGTVHTMGLDDVGQQGNGPGQSNQDTPQLVAGLPSTITAIAAGRSFALALADDGTVWGWGDGFRGQLTTGLIGGTGPGYEGLSVPMQLFGLSDIVKISAGDNHALGVKSDGTVLAWGADDFGQLGDGTVATPLETNVPQDVVGIGNVGSLSDVADVSAGALHSLARFTDDTAASWGFGGGGERGDGNTNNDDAIPNLVVGVGGSGTLTNVQKVVGGGTHSVALKTDGTVVAWGQDAFGQLGNAAGTVNPPFAPVQVTDVTGTGALAGISDVAAGEAFAVASSSSGLVYTWGRNNEGQLGTGSGGSGFDSDIPVQQDRLFAADRVGAGYFHAFAVADEDLANPTVSVSINGGATHTNSSSVTLTLSDADGTGSGVTSMQFSDDGLTFSGWEPFSATKAYLLPAGVGSKTVYAQVRDAVGRTSTVASDDITVETTPPTGTISIDGGATYASDSAVELTLSADDGGGAGVTDMAFSHDNVTYEPFESFATTKTWNLEGDDGPKITYVQFRDGAGNVSTVVSDTIILDTTAPTVVGVSPARKAKRSSNIVIAFSEDMRPSLLDRHRVDVSRKGSPIGASYAYDVATDRLVINPSRKLKKLTRYTVSIGVDAPLTDLAGNELAPVTRSFKTKAR